MADVLQMPENRKCRKCGWVHGIGSDCPDPNAVYEPSRYFTREHFACRCCGACALDSRLVPALDKLRELFFTDHKIEIVEAYRCEQSKGQVRGISKLAHSEGRAADIRIPGLSLREMYAMAELVPEFRDGGIGVYDDGTLHVDVRMLPARWGRVNGLYLGLESSGLI